MKFIINFPESDLYLYLEGESIGPFRMSEIREKYYNAEIKRSTFLWFAGLENWITVGDIPEFDRRQDSSGRTTEFKIRPNDVVVALKGKPVPLKVESIKALIEHQELRRADLVFCGNRSQWLRADQHPSTKNLFQSPLPPAVFKK